MTNSLIMLIAFAVAIVYLIGDCIVSRKGKKAVTTQSHWL